MPGFLFVQDFEGEMYMPNYCFHMEHPSGRRVLFDLGLRKVCYFEGPLNAPFCWEARRSQSRRLN